MSLVKFLIVLTIISVVSGRLSYYYADPNNNYHPPWDKYTNAYNAGDGTNSIVANNCNYTYTCPAGYHATQNTSYVGTYPATCPIPSWLLGRSDQNTALTVFNDCCRQYSICLQTCGVRKAFCDGQFEGCTYSSCNPTRVLRPGDRLYCRGLSSCITSYNARVDTCSTFAASQNAACTCAFGAPVSSTTGSALPFNTVTALPSASPVLGKRQDNSESASYSYSYSQVASISESESQSLTPSTVATLSPVGTPNLYNFQNYFVRPIPNWELFYNRCPPQFNNYVAVFTDQDQDDIGYYGATQGSSASMKSWMNVEL